MCTEVSGAEGAIRICERPWLEGSLGVGGEGRAIVLLEEETGEGLKSFFGEDIFKREKHAGRLARLRARLGGIYLGLTGTPTRQSCSEWRSASSSMSKASPEDPTSE